MECMSKLMRVRNGKPLHSKQETIYETRSKTLLSHGWVTHLHL
jgi:hypothetical protein